MAHLEEQNSEPTFFAEIKLAQMPKDIQKEHKVRVAKLKTMDKASMDLREEGQKSIDDFVKKLMKRGK